jgi:sulfur transfer protein SufE
VSSSETYSPKLKAVLSELAAVSDRELRSDLLIEYADAYQHVPETVAKRPYDLSHQVPGCESEVYIWALPHPSGKGAQFYFAVENPQGLSAKALSAVLDESLSGEDLSLVVSIPDSMVESIFGRSITMGKGQGLTNMVHVVKQLAKGLMHVRP